MLRVVTGQDDLVAGWLRANGHPFCEPFVALGVLDDDRLIGGVVYNNYNGFNMDASVAMERPMLTRGVLRALFDYPFNQAGCVRITARTHANNKDVRRKIRRLGFQPEGKCDRYYGEDAMQYRMLRDECRWING